MGWWGGKRGRCVGVGGGLMRAVGLGDRMRWRVGVMGWDEVEEWDGGVKKGGTVG